VKFHSHVALSYVVAMRLKHSRETPLIDVGLGGRNPSTSLRKGYASRFLSIATAESSGIDEDVALAPTPLGSAIISAEELAQA
jgi:hypothetical protein